MKKKIASILMALCSTFAITGLASCDIQEVLPDSGDIGNGSYTMELVDNGFNPLVAYGEAIDCTNLTLHYKQILNNKVIWDTTIPVSSQMFVSGGDTSTVGEKELVIAYETYQFTIDYEVKYRVEYSALDGVFNTQFVYDASEIVKQEAPSYEGYTFQYWKTEIPEVLTGNLAIDAQYYKDDLTAPTVETIVKTYAPNMTLGDFTLPSNEAGKWEFVDDLSTAITSVGSYDYAIRYVPATPEQPSVEDRTVRIVINQKEITVTAGEGNFIYNGKAQIPTYTFSESGLPIQRTIVAEGSATPLNEVPTNAGTYKVTFTLNNANYTLTNNVFTYEIARKQVAILSDVGTYVYNGQGQVPDYSVSEEGVNVVRNIYVEGTTTPLTEIPVNAGKYTITYTLNDANYELLVSAEDCTYEIARKEVTLQVKTKNFEYNGEKQFPNWTPSEEGLPIVKNVYVKGSNEPLTEDPMNAGTYTYVFTLDDPNYAFETVEGEYTIAPKFAYIEYEITDFDYNGKHQFPTFTPSDPNMEVVTSILLNNQTAVTECINAGTYYYTLSVTDPNYECEPVEESFTIYPKQVEITVSGTELTYNGQEQFPSVSAPEGVEVVGILPQKNAGTYTYAISPKSANYAGSAEGKFTIAQKQITFTVAEGTTSFVYDGEAHKPTITMEGAVEGEIVNVLENVEAKTSVGEYNYSITVMDSNYVGSIKGSFEIKALQLRITMDDKHMVYGNKVPEFTYTIEETLDGVTYTAYTGNTDILNITPNSYDVPNVGSYPITVTLGNENVEADIIEGTLTVYTGQSDPALPKLSSDEEYTAPMFGDKLGDVTFSVGLGTWAWDNPDQIIDKMEGFTATATFTSQNPNLAPTTKEFTLKYVQKRQLNFVVEESGRVYTYDGEPHSIVYTITDSKIEGKVYEDISVVGEVTQTNAGEYRTTLQIVSDCYVGSQLVDLVIKKATPTPTFTTLDNVKWSAALRLSDISLPTNFAWKADMDLDDVKTYECLAVYTHPEGTQNYEQVEGLFTFDVVRADNALNGVKEKYNFTFADRDFTLSGITATSGTTVLYQYTKDGESVDSLKDAGTYDVLVYVEQSDYYVYAETTTTVHIAKAKNNDTVNTTQNKTYGDMISSLALPTESSAIGTWSWKDAEGNAIENPTTTPVGNAGTVTLTAVFTPHTNYVKNYESREVTVTVNVGRKTIGEPTVGNLELTYTGEAQTVSVTPAEGTEGLYEVSGNVQTNAGTDYVIQLTLKEEHKDNYKWWTNQTDQTIAFKKFNIAKATNVVTVTQENWTYGQETTPAPEIEATFDADSKNFTFLYSSDGTNYDEQKPKNAGTYWIKAKIKVINSNYNTEESQPVEFKICKADPTDANFTTQYTVTWQEGLTLSGISLPSGYAWKTPTTALVPGQDEYEATYTKSINYNVKDGKFTVIVNKIETVISVNANCTFAYEESAFDTTNPTALQNWLGVSVNHAEGLNATYAFTYSGEMNPAPTTEIKYVGTYTLTITVAETAHYAEATKEVVITVNKKTNTQSINITTSYNKDLTLADLNDQFASYNEAGKGTWTWKDSTNSVGEVTAVNTPRTFEVVFTPTDSVNYASREAIAYLTVTKATPTLSVSITGWDYLQYNGSVNSPVPNYGTIQNTDGVTVRYVYKQGNTELTLDEMKNAEVGTYTVTAILDASDNFTYKASEPFTFYITQQKVAVPEIKNATYTGAPLDVVVKDAYVNDVGLYTLAPETKTEAGTHDITVTLKNTKNYAWTDGTTESKTVTFTIAKAEVTATISLTDTMGDALTYTTNTKQVAVAFTSNSNAITPTYTTTVNDVENGTILNAGFYAVTISLNDTDNYVLVAGGSKNFTIQQATNTWKVTPAMQDWTYGGTASSEVGEATFGNATLKALYEGTNYTSYKSSNKPTNAGTYQVTYSVAETTNYSGLSETVEFTIAKADVETFTISISGWVYDPENKNAVAPTYTTSNTDANRVVTYTYAPVDEHGTVGTYTATVPSTVGAYSVKADMQTTANFNATTSAAVEFAITKATPTLTVTLQGWTYSSDNANANAPSYETSNKEGATIAYLYTGTTNASVNYSSTEKPTQAGSYKVTATLGVTDNYTSAQAEANFTIAKATYTPNAPQITNEKVTYGDLLSSVILADNNNGYGHWAWVDTTEGLTVGNAGWRTFATKFVLDNTASYNYNAVPNQTAGFTVEKKTLQITAEGANSENVVTKIYNGFKQSISYTLKDGEETYTGLTVLGNTEYTTVGSYNITLTIYENNYVGQASFTLKIDKADLTDAEKTIEAKEAIYEDTLGMYALPTTDKGTWSWVDGNDTLVGGVGTKTFQAKFTGNGNYNDIEDVDVTFTVAPKTLYFEAQATQTYVYVAGQTYSLSYTLKDEAGKVYSSLNVIRDTKEQAGTYTNLSLALSETNYKAETLTGLTLIIKQAEYAVTLPTDLTATFGDKLSSVSLPEDSQGEWNWDGLYGESTVGNAGKNVFTAIFTPNDDNYAPANYQLTVNVQKAKVTIPSAITSKTYTGERLKADVSGTQDYTIFMNDGGIFVGNYNVMFVLSDFNNYQWDEENKPNDVTINGAYLTRLFKITVAKAEITALNITGWSYGATPNAPTAKTNFGTITYAYTKRGADTYTTMVPNEAGDYTVKASVAGSNNWDKADDVTKDFTISKAKVTPTLGASTMVYTGNILRPEVLLTGLTLTSDFTYTAVSKTDASITEIKNADTYVITITLTENGGKNHELTKNTLEFTVTKATPTLSVNIDGWTYSPDGSSANTPSYTTNNTDGGFTINYYYNTETGTISADEIGKAPAGKYTVYGIISETKNFLGATSVKDTFTISKARVLPTLGVSSAVYTGEDIPVNVSIYGLNSDQFTYTPATVKNAGTYSIVITLNENTANNYTLMLNTLTFTVNKATPIITSINISGWQYKNYDAEVNKVVATSNMENVTIVYEYFDANNVKVASTDLNNISAGICRVEAYVKGTENYEQSARQSATFIVTQREVKAPAIDSLVYTGSLIKPTITLTGTEDYTYIESSNTGGVDKGSYSVVFELKDYVNYKWVKPNDQNYKNAIVITTTQVTVYYEIVADRNVWIEGKEPAITGDNITTQVVDGITYYHWYFGNTSVGVNTPIAKYPIVEGGQTIPEEYAVKILYNGTANDGTVYQDATEMPTKAGTYMVTFSVKESADWDYLSKTLYFVIDKQIVNKPAFSGADNLTYCEGDAKTITIATDTRYEINYNGNVLVGNTVSETDAGTYTVYFTLNDSNNYIWEDEEELTTTRSFVINKANPNLSVIGIGNWTYSPDNTTADAPDFSTNNNDKTKDAHTITYTYYYKDGGAVITGDLHQSNNMPYKAGNYQVTVTIGETDNYNAFTSNKVDFTINRYQVRIPEIESKVYTGAPLTVSVKSEYQAERSYYNIAPETCENAGTHEITLSLIDSANRVWFNGRNEIEGKETKVNFVITKAESTVTVTLNDWTFNDTQLPDPVVTPSHGETGYTKTFKYFTKSGDTYTQIGNDNERPTNAGKYYVQVTIGGTANYQGATSGYDEFIINKDEVDTPNSVSKVYTGSVQTAYGNNATFELYTVETDGSGTTVGSYAVTYELKTPTNYKWKDDAGTITGTNGEFLTLNNFSITQAKKENITLYALTLKNWTYGAPANTPQVSWNLQPTIKNLVENNKAYYLYYTSKTGTGSTTVPTEFGTYWVQLVINATANYVETKSGLIEFSITARKVEKAEAKLDTTELIGTSQSFDYKGSAYALTLSVLGLNNASLKEDANGTLSGYTISIKKDGTDITRDNIKDYGTYVVTLTMNNKNYVWLNETKVTTYTFNIGAAKNSWKTDKQPSITAAWVYGATPTVYKGESIFGAAPSAAPSVAYYNYDATKDNNCGDPATHLDTNGIPTYVGKYVAVFTTATDGTNYKSDSKYIEFEITQTTVVATYSGTTTFTYENKDHTVGVKVTDTSNNNVALTSSCYELTNNTNQNAGTYNVTVTLTGDAAQNYMFAGDTDTFTFTTGWTIEQATATASLSVTDTIDGKAFTYTGNGKTVTATASVNSENYENKNEFAYTTSIPTIKNAGSYEVTLTLTDATNHKWAELTGLDDHVKCTINGDTLTYTITIDEEKVTLPTLNTYNNGKVEYNKVDGKDVIHVPVTDSQDKALYTVTVNGTKWNELTSMPVDDYKVVVSLNDKANYYWSALTAAGWTYNATEETFTYTYNVVAKKLTAPTYKVNNETTYSVEYNGGSVKITFGACEASYNVSIKDSHGNTFSATDVTDAETYTITLTLTNTNYLWNNGLNTITLTQTFTIAPTDANVDLTVNGDNYNGEFTYKEDGGKYNYVLTVNGVSGALTNGADKDYTYTITYTNVARTETDTVTEIKEAGTYVIALTMNNGNYNAITEKYTITIKPKEVSYTIKNVGTYTYNGSAQTPTIEVTPNVGYTPVITQTADGSADSSFAGSYSIAWNLNDTNNYTWKDSTPKATYTINPAKVTPVVKVGTTQIAKTGDSFVYTSGEYTVTVTIEDWTEDTDFTVDKADTIKGVDSYAVKITLSDDAAINYTFTENEKVINDTYTFSITPAEVKAEFTLTDDKTDDKGDAYTYTGYNKTVTATASVTSNGYVSTLEYTTDIPNDIKNATEYTVTYTLTDAVNHKWIPAVDGVKILSATVNGATLTVTFKVAQATNAWTTENGTTITENILSVTDWTYAPDTVHKPMAYAKFGEVKIYFSTINTTEQSAYTEWTDSVHPVNADMYYIIAVVEGNQNFNGLTTINDPVRLTIGSDELAEPTLGNNNDTIEYTESAQFPVDLNETAGGKYAVKVEYKATAEGSYAELADKTKTNVGYYKITLTLDNPVGVANYAWPTTLTNGWRKDGANANVIYYEYEITKATIEQPTLTFEDVSGNEIDATYYGGTFTVGGFDTAKYSYAISPEPIQDAGEYTVTLTMNDVISTNYKWWNGTGIFKFTITKATNGWTNGNEPSVNGGTNVWDYTGAVVEITKGVANCGSTATVNYVGREGTTYEESTAQPTNAGKYTAIFNVGESTNYGAIETTIDFEIKVKVIDIPTLATVPGAGPTTTEGSNHYIYKWIANKTYTVWTITNPVEYTVAGDTASFETGASYVKKEGTITLTLKNPQDEGNITAINYKWNGADTQTVTITYLVEHKVYVPVPTIYLNGAESNESTRPSGTLPYGGIYVLSVAPSPQYTWTFTRTEGDDYDKEKATPVGTYTLTVWLNTGYKWNTDGTEKGWSNNADTLTYSFKITQATNSWSTTPSINGTFAEGQGTEKAPYKWEYVTTNPAHSINNGVAKFGENATYLVEGTTVSGASYSSTTALPTDAGDYTITFTVSADTNGNYTGLSTTIYFEITPKEIRFEAKEDWTKGDDGVYTRTYNGQEIEFADTSSDYKLVDKDGKDLTTKSLNAKSYTVYAQLSDENYVWADSNGSTTNLALVYVVNRAEIQVSHTFTKGIYYEWDWDNEWTTNKTSKVSVFTKYEATIVGTISYSVLFSGNAGSVSVKFTLPSTTAGNYAVKNAYVLDGITIKAVAKDIDTRAYYGTIENALENTSGTVQVLLDTGIVISSNCTVGPGVTLIVPYADSASTSVSVETDRNRLSDSARSTYCKTSILIKENVTLTNQGTIYLMGQINAGISGSMYAGATGGYYAEFRLENGATITNESGSKFENYGYIVDKEDCSGNFILNNGSSCYTPLVVYDFRGGTNTLALISSKICVPFNQFDIPNIQTTFIINYGASLTCESHFAMRKLIGSGLQIVSTGAVNFIGSTSAYLFEVRQGTTVIIKYNRDTAVFENNYMKIDVNGDLNINSMILEVSRMTMNTSEYVLPLSFRFKININSGTTRMEENDFKFMPGSELNIRAGATVRAKTLIFYDGSYEEQGSGLPGACKTAVDNQGSAQVNVAGTLIATTLGGYVTAAGPNATIRITGNSNVTVKDINANGNGGKNTSYTAKGSIFSRTDASASEGSLDLGIIYYGMETSTNEVYAWYKAVQGEITVTYNLMSGTATIANQTKGLTYAENYGALDVPTNTGYVFQGWYFDEALTNRVNANTKVTNIADHTLYAKWIQAEPVNVSFVTNGGTEVAIQTYGQNVEYGYFPETTLEGYTLEGWYLDQDLTNRVTESTKALADPHTLYAKWTANTYTIVFDSNGGSGVMENQTMTYNNIPTNLISNKFKREGYTFSTWNTKADGTGTNIPYTIQENLTAEANAVIVLYAQWTGREYTVTFDPNGGTCNTKSQKVTFGSPYDTHGTLPKATREGYQFEGWYITITQGDVTVEIKITDNTPVAIADNVTAKASWVKVYTIRLDGNGGTLNPSTITVVEGGTLSLDTLNSIEATYVGHTLAGWVDASGNDPFTNSEEIPVTSDMTLKAVWKINVYTVTINIVANNSCTFNYCNITGNLVSGNKEGTTSRTITVEYGQTIEIEAKATRSGKTGSDNASITISKDTTITVTASYTNIYITSWVSVSIKSN